MPIEPPASSWGFPDPTSADEHGVVGVGADLEPGTLLAAYRCGLFPMPLHRQRARWRGGRPTRAASFRSRTFGSAVRCDGRTGGYEIRIDTAFAEVLDACGSPRRPGGWINAGIRAAYGELHRLGWAHSVEAWDDDGLAGGLYGVATGGLFAGESMFHRRRDASKVALVALVELLRDGQARRLLDVQWTTDHLVGLGAVDVPRAEYLERLRTAIDLPLPAIWA